MKKRQAGMTRQGVRDLSNIKGKSVGIRLSMPPTEGMQCEHPQDKLRYDHMSGCTHCGHCRTTWDFDGRTI